MWMVPQTSIRLARLCRLVSVLSSSPTIVSATIVRSSIRPPVPALGLACSLLLPLNVLCIGRKDVVAADQETRRPGEEAAQCIAMAQQPTTNRSSQTFSVAASCQHSAWSLVMSPLERQGAVIIMGKGD